MPDLLDIENGQVRFEYKDYRSGGKKQQMALTADEFIRRFLLHVLPTGFKKIRHFGLFSNGARSTKLVQAQQLLSRGEEPAATIAQPAHRKCPACKQGLLRIV